MPAAGAAWRGEQLALLAGQLHERQSSEAYAELVASRRGRAGRHRAAGAAAATSSSCGWS